MSNHVDNGGLNGLWDLSLVQCRALQGSADEGCCGRGPTPLERLDSKSPRLERLDSKSPRLGRLDSLRVRVLRFLGCGRKPGWAGLGLAMSLPPGFLCDLGHIRNPEGFPPGHES